MVRVATRLKGFTGGALLLQGYPENLHTTAQGLKPVKTKKILTSAH